MTALDLHDLIRELTEPTRHAEPFSIQRGKMLVNTAHITTNPALLDQLAESVEQSGSSEDGQRAGFGSKPTARLDAIDTLLRIDHQAGDLVTELGGDRQTDTKTLVRRVGALAAAEDEHTTRRITKDVERWWTWARVATGWDIPAWSPDSTCPICGTRGSLRIRLASHIGMCTEDTCRETWGPDNIGLLADHIRAECEDEGRVPPPLLNRSRTADGATPCQCRTCQEVDADALVLCPACASSRCPRSTDHIWPCEGLSKEAS